MLGGKGKRCAGRIFYNSTLKAKWGEEKEDTTIDSRALSQKYRKKGKGKRKKDVSPFTLIKPGVRGRFMSSRTSREK